MNIEEILDNLKDSFENPTYMQRVYGSEDYDEIDNDYLLEPDKCKILYDYIKQLQKENQKCKEVIDKAKKHIEDVAFYQSPNEFVKVLIEILADKEVE